MLTNLENRARERQKKENVGGRPAKLNEKKGDSERSRARDQKTKETFFLLEEQRENFVAAVTT